VQRLRRLIDRRSARAAEGCFVVEGVRVLVEALESGAEIESVYVASGGAGPAELALAEQARAKGALVFELEAGVLARIAGTVSPQPILAVVVAAPVDLAVLGARRPDLVVVCVDVRDPGNAGVVLRSAEAAGADAVVACDGVVDPYNPKTVRASAGAIFHIPLVAGGEAGPVLDLLAGWGLRRWGTVARGGVDYAEADLCQPVALVVGNEANGLPERIRPHLDGELTIPMRGRAESLNVGTAAAVICFEAARQRRAARA
jgi:RNA methyltransferase, TrmH family